MNLEWKQCLKIGISIFLLYLGIHYWASVASFVSLFFSALTPVIIGLVIAYLVNILMMFYERKLFPKTKPEYIKGGKRSFCMAAAIITMLGIIALLTYMIIPELITCIETFIDGIPNAVKNLTNAEFIHKIIPEKNLIKLEHIDWKSYIDKGVGFLTSGITGAVSTVAEVAFSAFSILFTTIIGIIFSIYFLTGKEEMIANSKKLMKTYMKPSWYKKTMHYLCLLGDCCHNYIVGKAIDAVVLGVMCIVGMWIFRFDYAVMIGALVGFCAIIPVVGGYIGAGIGSIMMLTVSPTQALLFLIYILVLQLVEGNVIYPKIMGNSLGLPGIWVLAAVTVGGSLSGIVGMLIAVPIVAALYKAVKEDVARREKERQGVHDKREERLKHKEDIGKKKIFFE